VFESIGIKRINHSDTSNPIDIGFIAESMLFYKRVTILADHVILANLVNRINLDDLLELLKQGYLEIQFVANSPAIATDPSQFGNLNNVVLYEIVQDAEETIFKSLFELTDRRGYSKRSSNKIASYVKTSSFDTNLANEITQDFQNQEYLNKALKSILSDLVPAHNIMGDIFFNLHKTDKGLITETNLNFESINSVYHKYVSPSHSTITDAYLLSHLANVRTEIHAATKFNSEIATDSIYSNVMRIFFNDVIQKFSKNSGSIDSFQDLIFDDGKDIRSVINSGEKSMRDIIDVLAKADKFKQWLNQIDNDKNLIKEYYKEITASSFIDKLPSKSVRWAIFTGAGLALDSLATGGLGTLAGLALGAGDTFILDKLIHKWKPSQFVDKELKQLVSGK
jgi:hypothetical protein